MLRLPIASVVTGIVLAMLATILWAPRLLTRQNDQRRSVPNERSLMTAQPAASPSDSGSGQQLASAHHAPLSSAGAAACPVDPDRTLGVETCVKCHAGEVGVWKSTPHARTFDEMHRRPEAKQIADRLGLRSIKHDGRCTECHYTLQTDPTSGSPHAISGISCESCHGSAKRWLDVHHNYGGEHFTRAMESPEHRYERLSQSVELGMRNPVNVYLVAQSCLRCHTTSDEELVNVGGHPTGSLDFEFVSWSQGTIRHNFVRSDGKSNDVSPIERLRVMFVSGMIAELESSLRATAKATQKATYGITVAQRTARAANRLQSVGQKINSPILNDVISVMSSVELRLNHSEQLTAAAEMIAGLGYRFAAETDGRELSALDEFIPTTDRWK